MPPLPPPSLWRELQRTAETLLIAALGGIAVAATGFPAGLVMGSMLAAAVAALAGRPVMVMLPVARASFVLVGILLGAVVTPEMVKGIADWPASVAILVVSALVMFRRHRLLPAVRARLGAALRAARRQPRLDGAGHGAVGGVQRRPARHRRRAGDAGAADRDRPAGGAGAARARTVDPAPPEPRRRRRSANSPSCSSVSTAVAAILQRVRFPGGLLFGALAARRSCTAPACSPRTLPWWLGSAAIVTLGAVAGSRFANTSPRMLLGYLGAALRFVRGRDHRRGLLRADRRGAACRFGWPTSSSRSRRARRTP